MYTNLKTIVNNEGFLALYKGLSATYIGMIHPLIFFPLYEKTKIYMLDNYESKQAKKLSALNIFLCSTFSKTIASMASYPYELFRSRLYYERSSIWLH